MKHRLGRIVIHIDTEDKRANPYRVEIVWDDDDSVSPWASWWFATRKDAEAAAKDYACEAGIRIVNGGATP